MNDQTGLEIPELLTLRVAFVMKERDDKTGHKVAYLDVNYKARNHPRLVRHRRAVLLLFC
jgi:hypothetical protein